MKTNNYKKGKTNKFAKLPLLFVTLTLIIACFFCGCNSKPDYLSYVSELRKDIFVGEKDNFCVVVHLGSKESPALFDGVKNQTVLLLTFKVTQKEEVGSQIFIKFKTGDKEYEQALAFNPVKSTLSCEVEVNSLPEKSLDVEVIHGENSTIVTTTSKLQPSTISYTKALEIAVGESTEFLKEHTSGGILKCEIVIRLLCENERNYYYVGFVCEQGLKRALLINGETGEVIATKKN